MELQAKHPAKRVRCGGGGLERGLEQIRYMDEAIATFLYRCNVSPSPTDVSPTENSWMLHPLDKVFRGYFAPDRTIPSPNFDFLIFLIIILGGLYGCD
jgi:hypothetical protein